MSMRTYNRALQSYPSPESDTNQPNQSSAPNLETLHQHHQGSRISAERLSKILDASLAAQKMGMSQAMDAVSLTTGNNSDWKFINCYLDNTELLLDGCNSIQLRLESIRSCLDMIPIGLYYLEGEHEPSKVVLQRAAAALESSRFRDKRHCCKMEKSVSRMRTFGKKLNKHTLKCQDTGDSVSPELYKALNGSWEMAVLAIGMLSSATSLNSPCVRHHNNVEPRTMLLSEPSNKMKASQKKSDETVSMEELATADLAIKSLLKLISASQKGGSSSLRRMAVRVVAGELKRRNQVLEKTLSLLEEKIGGLYWQIVALRISMLGLLSKAQREEVLEMAEPSSYKESQIDTNAAQYRRGVAWIKFKTKVSRRSFTRGRIRPHCIGLIKTTSIKSSSVNV